MILDLASTEALQLSRSPWQSRLGAVYWLVRDHDRRIERDRHRNTVSRGDIVC